MFYISSKNTADFFVKISLLVFEASDLYLNIILRDIYYT